MDMDTELPRGPAENQRVGVAAMIGGKDDSVARVERRFESVEMANLGVDDTFVFAKVSVVEAKRLNEPWPKRSANRRDELVGSLEDEGHRRNQLEWRKRG